jgi:hypothetical protein
MRITNPTAWFDQLPTDPDWPKDSQWCARHWAPCPVLGGNGIGVTMEVMRIFLDEVASPEAKSPEALNRAMAAAGRLCCTLGDERMYEIWGHWPPPTKTEAGNGSS